MLKVPTVEHIASILSTFQMTATEDDIAEYRDLVEESIAGNALIDEMPNGPTARKHAKREWQRPAAAENPYNAWYVTTNIMGSDNGKLTGKTIAIILIGSDPHNLLY